MKPWKNILLASLYTLALGCGGNTSSGLTDGASEDPDEETGTGSNSPLSLSLQSNLRFSDTFVTEGSCEATALDPHATCTISIDELTLYYSSLKFIISAGSRAYCEQVVFRPFRYTRSTNAAFAIGGSTSTLDCSLPVAERDPKCWGGLASEIVTGFPKYTAEYFLMENGLSSSFTAKSSDERYGTDIDYSMQTNANATNNLALVDRATGLATPADDVDYVANTYVDNFIGCYDTWGNLDYSITFTIRDEDETGGGTVPDEFWDWFD